MDRAKKRWLKNTRIFHLNTRNNFWKSFSSLHIMEKSLQQVFLLTYHEKILAICFLHYRSWKKFWTGFLLYISQKIVAIGFLPYISRKNICNRFSFWHIKEKSLQQVFFLIYHGKILHLIFFVTYHGKILVNGFPHKYHEKNLQEFFLLNIMQKPWHVYCVGMTRTWWRM